MAGLPKKHPLPDVFEGEEHWRWILKKLLILITAVLFFSSGVVTPVFAIDDYSDMLILADISYDNAVSSDREERSLEGPAPASFDYYKIEGEKFGDMGSGINDGRLSNGGDLFRSNLSGLNAPRSMIGQVSYDFQKGADREPGFDFSGPSDITDTALIGSAFLTNLVVHEFGHEVVANHVDAKGSKLDFLTNRDGSFFLGMSTVDQIDDNSRLPYHMGGEFFSDITFEHALRDYRQNPNMYNKALMLFSGTDFVWYSFYAFYLSDGNTDFDPVSVQEETGLSNETIFSIALAKTLMNAYRVYSGQDHVVPYFTVDAHSVKVNVAITF